MMIKKDDNSALQQVLQQYEELKSEHPKTLEAIFFLTQPEKFRHEDSFHIKELNLSKYQTTQHPLDIQFYKRVSRIIPSNQLKNLPSQDEI